jgi:hypothetical protein
MRRSWVQLERGARNDVVAAAEELREQGIEAIAIAS